MGNAVKKVILVVSLGLLTACSTTDEQTREPTTSTVPVWTGDTWLYLPVQGSASLATSEEDQEAKNFLSVPDMAVLYIYRNQFRGSAWQIPITINGKLIGRTGGYTFFRITLAPGEHVVESWAEKPAQITLNLEAGKVYYVRHKTKTGMTKIRAELQLVGKETGQKGVNESNLLRY